MSNYRIHLDAPDTGYVLERLVYGRWVRVGIYPTSAAAMAARA